MINELLHDTNIWVTISFVIFMGVFWKYGRQTVLDKLDTKINTIREELENAEKLRVEAQELLAEYQRKHKDAMNEADDIIARAKETAKSMKKQAEDDLKATMTRREEQLAEKLKRIEENAVQDVKAYTAKIAVDSARDILASKLDTKSDKAIQKNIIDQVSKAVA